MIKPVKYPLWIVQMFKQCSIMKHTLVISGLRKDLTETKVHLKG